MYDEDAGTEEAGAAGGPGQVVCPVSLHLPVRRLLTQKQRTPDEERRA